MSGGNEHNGAPSSGSASNGHFNAGNNNNNNSINNTITITTPSGHTTNNNILINNHHINNINCNILPIISVTPHSPGAKYNSILEDSLSHLQSIRETVQQMKNSSGQNASFVNMGITNPQLAASKTFHSCPSLPNLSVSNAIWLAAQNAMTYTLNDNRRKSWTAIEDLTDCTKNSHKRYIHSPQIQFRSSPLKCSSLTLLKVICLLFPFYL
jgi:hypothetical protein